jgi:hypothetical protein
MVLESGEGKDRLTIELGIVQSIEEVNASRTGGG